MNPYFHSTNGYQTWKGGELPWGTPIYKVTWPFDHVVFWNQVTNYAHYTSSTRVPECQVSHDTWKIVPWSWKITWQKNHYISPSKIPMATKLVRLVAYLEGLLPIKSNDTLITWSCDITRQTNIHRSPLLQYTCPLNLADWWPTMKGSHP